MISSLLTAIEHNAPMKNLVPNYSLKKGEDTGIFPRVGRITVDPLVEGQDIVTEKDIGMITVSVSTSEVGAKVILTDKLLHHNVSANFGTTGEQLGEGMARRLNEDIVGLFSGLNGGTDLGAAGRALTSANATIIITNGLSRRFGGNQVVVHHPVAIGRLLQDATTLGSGTIRPIPEGWSARLLGKYYSGVTIYTVPFFHTGDITRDGSDDAIGAIFSKFAMGLLWTKQMKTERQRDASLRAWELVITSDYAAFEHDDTRGAPVTMDAADPATT
jgi:hypothetical protein